MSLKPLIKWSGGKVDELRHILPHIPSFNGYYLEPFLGGAAVFFHLAPTIQAAVLSDVHVELMDFYRMIQQGRASDLIQFMKDHPNDEETYYEVRAWSPETVFERAARFFYLRKTCFRGMMRYNRKGQFNIPFGKYKTIQYDALADPRYEEALSKGTLLTTPFEAIFNDYNDESNFMFLDPPYDSTFTDYGYCSFGREEHEALAHAFKTTHIRCLMIIGQTPFIETLYEGYIVGRYEKAYKFRLYGNRIQSDAINNIHLIIRNY